MTDIGIKPRTKVQQQTDRQRLHKVILLNDDYTPRSEERRVGKEC